MIDYKKYCKDWKTKVRPEILKRAKNKCESCGVNNYDTGYRDNEGKFYNTKIIIDALENDGYDYFSYELSNCWDSLGNPTTPIKIVLTIAHLDHDINNNDYSNLKALCQRCHLRYDIKQHKKTKRDKKNIYEMFCE